MKEILGTEPILSSLSVDYLSYRAEGRPSNLILEEETSLGGVCIANLIAASSLMAFHPSRFTSNHAFYHGEVLGMVLTRRFLPVHAQVRTINALQENGHIDVHRNILSQKEETLRVRAEIGKLATQGWELASPHYGELLEAWSWDICNDAKSRPNVQRGFGYVISVANDTWNKLVENEFHKNFNADAMGSELDKLLGRQGSS